MTARRSIITGKLQKLGVSCPAKREKKGDIAQQWRDEDALHVMNEVLSAAHCMLQ